VETILNSLIYIQYCCGKNGQYDFSYIFFSAFSILLPERF